MHLFIIVDQILCTKSEEKQIEKQARYRKWEENEINLRKKYIRKSLNGCHFAGIPTEFGGIKIIQN